MKQLIYLFCVIIFGWSCSNLANEKTGIYDVRAVEVLDSLGSSIGELASVSYTLNTIVQEKDSDGDIVEVSNEHDVYMRGPNKLMVHTNGAKGERSFWYNGTSFAYFSYSTNEYDTMAAPSTILETVDLLNQKFNIDFPAADFFYPTLTDDMLTNFDKLLYWGTSQVEDQKTDIISAYNDNVTVQIWINNASKLPVKFIIFEEGEKKGERYEAIFSNWKLNPELPDILFEYSPTANAKKVSLQPRKKQ